MMVPACPPVTVEVCVTVVEIVEVLVEVQDFREVTVGICRTEEQYADAPCAVWRALTTELKDLQSTWRASSLSGENAWTAATSSMLNLSNIVEVYADQELSNTTKDWE